MKRSRTIREAIAFPFQFAFAGALLVYILGVHLVTSAPDRRAAREAGHAE